MEVKYLRFALMAFIIMSVNCREKKSNIFVVPVYIKWVKNSNTLLITRCEALSDGTYVGLIERYEVNGRLILRRMTSYTCIEKIKVHPSKNWMATIDTNGISVIWNTHQLKPLAILQKPANIIDVTWSQNSHEIYLENLIEKKYIWDIIDLNTLLIHPIKKKYMIMKINWQSLAKTTQYIKKIKGYHPYRFDFFDDNKLMLGIDNYILILSIKSSRSKVFFSFNDVGIDANVTKDGKKFAIITNNILFILNNKGKILFKKKFDIGINALDMSKDGDTIAVATSHGLWLYICEKGAQWFLKGQNILDISLNSSKRILGVILEQTDGKKVEIMGWDGTEKQKWFLSEWAL